MRKYFLAIALLLLVGLSVAPLALEAAPVFAEEVDTDPLAEVSVNAWQIPFDTSVLSPKPDDSPWEDGVNYLLGVVNQEVLSAVVSCIEESNDYYREAQRNPSAGEQLPIDNRCLDLGTSGAVADCSDGFCSGMALLRPNERFEVYHISQTEAMKSSRQCEAEVKQQYSQNSAPLDIMMALSFLGENPALRALLSQFQSEYTAKIRDCFAKNGCEIDSDLQSGVPFSCELTIQRVGAFNVSDASVSTEPQSGELQQTLSPWVAALVNAPNQRDGDSFSAPSVLSGLPIFVPSPGTFASLAVTGVGSIVLVILVLLPSQLINSTLLAHQDLFRRPVDLIRKKLTPLESPPSRPESLGGSAVNSARTYWRVVRFPIALLASSVIVGLVDPRFGFNGLTLRLVLTSLVAFALLSYLFPLATWFIYERSHGLRAPRPRFVLGYSLLLLGSVLASRFTPLDPVIVIGAVVVFETTRSAVREIRDHRSKRSAGARELIYAGLTLVGGVAFWLGYSSLMSQSAQLSTWQVSAGELLSLLTIEAIATLPVLLLPLHFMPGAKLFAWNKWVWVMSYAVVLTSFVFILVPLPGSWGVTSSPLLFWVATLGSYMAFAVIFWMVFRFIPSPRRKVKASPAKEASVMTSEDIIQAEEVSEGLIRRRMNTFAVLGLLAAIFLPAGVLAIILGNIALTQISRYGDSGRSLAVTSLVIGYLRLAVSIVFWALIVVGAMTFVPDFLTNIENFMPTGF